MTSTAPKTRRENMAPGRITDSDGIGRGRTALRTLRKRVQRESASKHSRLPERGTVSVSVANGRTMARDWFHNEVHTPGWRMCYVMLCMYYYVM